MQACEHVWTFVQDSTFFHVFECLKCRVAFKTVHKWNGTETVSIIGGKSK